VVPAYIDGAFRAWPKGSAIPKPRRITIRIGEARRYPDVPASRPGSIAVAADLRRAVLEQLECVRKS
jgi:1-acyl-sn-glycerol-3-phosphate acyltransferase